MRCECCNEMLTVSEESLRFKNSKTLAYTCRHCLNSMDTPVMEQNDSYEDDDIISLDELLELEGEMPEGGWDDDDESLG